MGSEGNSPGFSTREEASRNWSPQKILMLVVIIVLLAAIIGPSFILSLVDEEDQKVYDSDDGKYRIHIQRDYDTNREKKAIKTAEDLDLPSLMDTERFDPYYGSSWTNEMDVTDGYAWPRLVDGTALDFYIDRYGYMKEIDYLMSARLSYDVECQYVDRLSIQPWNRTEGPHYRYTYHGLNASHELATFDEGGLHYLNLTGVPTDGEWYELNEAFVVRQDLEYSEVEAPLAGYFGHVDQLVILDKDYDVVIVLVHSMNGIS